MPKVDHLTKLEIVRRFHEGEKVTAIRKRLAERGIVLSWHTINYHTSRYVTGEYDHEDIPDIQDQRKTNFSSVTGQQIKEVEKALTKEPLQSGRDVQKLLRDMGADVSRSTTSRVINAAGFTSSSTRYCQLIRDANKLKRIVFCNQLIDTNDTLDNIIFTDETSVQLHQNKQSAYRPTGSLPTMRPKPKHPLKVHLWAGISRRGPTPLLIFEGIMKAPFYTTEILQNTLLPFIQQRFPDSHRFQQDNDPKHTSRMAKDFMAQHNINWWNTPAESPDLNPIEMVWNQVKRYVARVEPSTKDELTAAIQNFWSTTMTVELCNTYIDHLFKVAPVCVIMEGKATGDVPNRLFTERSRGRSFSYFNDQLQQADVQARAAQYM